MCRAHRHARCPRIRLARRGCTRRSGMARTSWAVSRSHGPSVARSGGGCTTVGGPNRSGSQNCDRIAPAADGRDWWKGNDPRGGRVTRSIVGEAWQQSHPRARGRGNPLPASPRVSGEAQPCSMPVVFREADLAGRGLAAGRGFESGGASQDSRSSSRPAMEGGRTRGSKGCVAIVSYLARGAAMRSYSDRSIAWIRPSASNLVPLSRSSIRAPVAVAARAKRWRTFSLV